MSHAGFDIRGSPILITTHALYCTMNSRTPVIVLFHLRFPGHLSCQRDQLPHATAKHYKGATPPISPRIIPIPTIIFRHLHHESMLVSVESLCDIWNESFENASSSIGLAKFSCDLGKKIIKSKVINFGDDFPLIALISEPKTRHLTAIHTVSSKF